MIADWIIRLAQRTPYFHLDGYMERWWLVPPSKFHPFSARVHHILRSDNDRHFHDHPWSYLSIILKGGYWEHTHITDAEFVASRDFDEVTDVTRDGFNVRKWYGPGSVLRRAATSTHRLELPPGQTAWTLFCMGPYRQGWGFLTEKGKVPWREYLGVAYAAATDAKLGQAYARAPARGKR